MSELYPGQAAIIAGKLKQAELLQQADQLRADAETDPLRKAAILTRLAAGISRIAGFRATLEKCESNETSPRDLSIRTRLTAAEHAALRQAADEAGQTISQYVRSRIL